MAEPPAKRQKTMPGIPTVIDATKTPAGDLVIRAGPGDDAVRIRVHSVLLRIASPVFRAMLGPNFVEGSTQYTAEHPLVLEDDDPQGMLDLFALLHHQYAALIPPTRLPKLVVVADKYQCVELIKSPVLAAFTKYFPAPTIHETTAFEKAGFDLGGTMCMAYAVGDATLFWGISRALVLTTTADECEELIDRCLLDLLPDAFPDAMRKLQREEHKRVVTRLEQVEEDLIDARPFDLDYCDRLKYTVAQYNCQLSINCLKRRQLHNFDTTPLSQTYARAGKFADSCDPPIYRINKITCTWHVGACPTKQVKQNILKIVETSDRDRRGLCLECLRTGSKAWKTCGHEFET